MTDPVDDLLDHYLGELAYLRTAGAAFGRRYPRIAQRLEQTGDGSADPELERLLESVAFLTARLQRRIDRQVPDVARHLLDVLYPALTAPIPPAAIAAVEVEPSQGRLVQGVHVPRETGLFARADSGELCRFRTAAPLHLWPLDVVDVQLDAATRHPFLDSRPEVGSVLTLRLEVLGGHAWGAVRPPALRFHAPGLPVHTARLMDMLLGETLGLHLRPASADADAAGVDLPPAELRPVGFAADEALLPWPPTALDAYRHVLEYFVFPEKFHFIDVNLAAETTAIDAARAVDLHVLLPAPPRRPPTVEAGSLRLGCVPIVNLFSQIAEPIRFDRTRLAYPLEPDALRAPITEVHSIRRVRSRPDDALHGHDVEPLYGFRKVDGSPCYYIARRTAARRPDLGGSDVELSFLDLDLAPTRPAFDVVFAHLLCTNRNLAPELSPGAPLAADTTLPSRAIRCLARPTPPLPALAERAGVAWQLVTQLALNRRTLDDGPFALEALRELLGLYGGLARSDGQRQLLGLRRLEVQPATRHVLDGRWPGVARGLDLTLTVDQSAFVGASPLLLGTVLERFFGLYTAVNSFTQCTLLSGESERPWKTWPPRCGAEAAL